MTGNHTREARGLRFWFKPEVSRDECPYQAQAFFRELVSPQDFPKGKIHFLYFITKKYYLISFLFLKLLFSDYVGFIKKIIKLMQNKYHQLKLLEVELRQEGSGPPPPG